PMAVTKSRPRTPQGADPAPAAVPHRATPSGPSVIEFRGVEKRYDVGAIGLVQATFSIGRGEWAFLVGSTGSGKSTIMRLLIKELEPTAGSIRVAGRDLAEIERKRVPYYRRNI